jgi:hypothetical protein
MDGERTSQATGRTRRIALTSLATVAVAALGGVVWAGSSGSSPHGSGTRVTAASQPMAGGDGQAGSTADRGGGLALGRGRGFGHGRALGHLGLAAPGLRGLGRPLHGEVTVALRSGGYRTLAFQVGTVRSTGSTSVTVASADGFARRYVVGSASVVRAGANGLASIRSGHRVRVVASVAKGAATVLVLDDQTLVGDLRPGGDTGSKSDDTTSG